ncbi:MAG TPA: hypothetical protein VHQ90_01310 [Thermoanaerobaculia bacterium]|nr:hypothetical protein [Thermoanaerobaculia bacterium]
MLSEPAAARLAEELARTLGCQVETHRRPASLAPLLQDLRTYSLFTAGKVLLAVDTAAFADRSAAANLIDDAAESAPDDPASPGRHAALSPRQRQAAARLLQALRLFEIDPRAGSPEQAIAQLPAWVLEGGQAARRGRGGRPRGKRQVEDVRSGLAALLAAARHEQMQDSWGGELADLASLIRGGLPPGHAVVFAERTVAPEHPLFELLAGRGAVAAVGEVESERGSWQGLDLLAAELAEQTGAAIQPDALAELARRTLRQAKDGKWGSQRTGADADSTARLAGEYRKLATLVGPAGGSIDRKLVEQAVEDRGEEDVWQLLDAISLGRGEEALARLRRLVAAADEPLAARLSFFALLAAFCRQMTAIRGVMRIAGLPAGEDNYGRFKTRLAPALQGDLPTGKNPLAGLHPYRLHRAYLAASRIPEPMLAQLPSQVLETELQLKGESGNPDAALARLVTAIATSAPAAGGRRGGLARS